MLTCIAPEIRASVAPANTRADVTPIKVLICEDQAVTALRLRKDLQALGYQVVGEAADGREAVAKALECAPQVILMDVHMPHLDGIQATERIMRERPAAVVMVTAYNEPALVQRALDAGASGYLVKPVRSEQLQPAIAMALDRFRQLRRYENQARHLQRENAGLQSTHDRDRFLADEAEQRAAATERLAVELRLRLQEERQAARLLAETFLCPLPALAGYELASQYEPAWEAALVGGDYYDFLDLGPGRTGIVIGDACGKGVPAAAFTAKARYMLRAFAAEDPRPAQVLTRLNRALVADPSEDVPFLTLIYGVLEHATGRWTYANGGHPGPVLHTPGEAALEGRCSSLPTTGLIVGGVPDVDYTEESRTLAPGGTLVLFTDGITEAWDGQEMLNVEGVCAVVNEYAAEGAATISHAVLQRAREFSGGNLRDDTAVVVLRRNPPEPVP